MRKRHVNQFGPHTAAPSSVQFSPFAYSPLMKYMRKPDDDRYQQTASVSSFRSFFYYCNFSAPIAVTVTATVAAAVAVAVRVRVVAATVSFCPKLCIIYESRFGLHRFIMLMPG